MRPPRTARSWVFHVKRYPLEPRDISRFHRPDADPHTAGPHGVAPRPRRPPHALNPEPDRTPGPRAAGTGSTAATLTTRPETPRAAPTPLAHTTNTRARTDTPAASPAIPSPDSPRLAKSTASPANDSSPILRHRPILSRLPLQPPNQPSQLIDQCIEPRPYRPIPRHDHDVPPLPHPRTPRRLPQPPPHTIPVVRLRHQPPPHREPPPRRPQPAPPPPYNQKGTAHNGPLPIRRIELWTPPQAPRAVHRHPPSHTTVRRFRPFSRRAFSTSRPARVDIRFKKPCSRFREMRCG